MLAMAHAFCGDTTVPKSWQRRCGYFDGQRAHDLLCCHAESCARSIRATPELALAKATAELEKLYLT